MSKKIPDHPSPSPEIPLPFSIVLVGMMGVGKTTIGRRLAPKVGLPFHDADEEIEQAAGMKVADIFQTHGETAFRDGEVRVINRLLNGPPIVLATGGGAVLREETRTLIRDKSLSIWLKAPVDIILERATRRPTRPLLKNGNPKEIIERLLEERSPHYATAHIQLDSRIGPHIRTVNAILDLVATHQQTDQQADKTPT